MLMSRNSTTRSARNTATMHLASCDACVRPERNLIITLVTPIPPTTRTGTMSRLSVSLLLLAAATVLLATSVAAEQKCPHGCAACEPLSAGELAALKAKWDAKKAKWEAKQAAKTTDGRHLLGWGGKKNAANKQDYVPMKCTSCINEDYEINNGFCGELWADVMRTGHDYYLPWLPKVQCSWERTTLVKPNQTGCKSEPQNGMWAAQWQQHRVAFEAGEWQPRQAACTTCCPCMHKPEHGSN